MEHQEPLKPSAVISKLPDTIQAQIHNLFPNGIMASGKVVGGVFLAADELLRVEQLAVGSGSDLVDDSGFQIYEHSARDVLSGAGFTEEGVEGIVTTTDGLVAGHLAIRLDTMFETVKLPAGVSDLDTGLADVDRNALSHFRWVWWVVETIYW